MAYFRNVNTNIQMSKTYFKNLYYCNKHINPMKKTIIIIQI